MSIRSAAHGTGPATLRPGQVSKRGNLIAGHKSWPVVLLLAAALIAAILFSFTLGHYQITISDIWSVLMNQLFGIGEVVDHAHVTVMTQVRLPRIIAAVTIGAALAGAGASYQGLFKNPMVSPDILGASAGAGFGACAALLLGFGTMEVQLTAFAFGMIAVILTYSISVVVSRGSSMTLCLVLTGMVVSALFQALITMSKYCADPDDQLPAITYWLMGGLASIKLTDLPVLLLPVLIGLIPMIAMRYQLNALSFGDEEARALGVNVKAIRAVYISCATLVSASSVAAAGMIGWVGLVIPHLSRMIVGPNYKVLLPVSLLLGSIYMLLIDDMCRCLFKLELPLSVLTAVIGAPFFIYLLLKGRKTWA